MHLKNLAAAAALVAAGFTGGQLAQDHTDRFTGQQRTMILRNAQLVDALVSNPAVEAHVVRAVSDRAAFLLEDGIPPNLKGTMLIAHEEQVQGLLEAVRGLYWSTVKLEAGGDGKSPEAVPSEMTALLKEQEQQLARLHARVMRKIRRETR